MHLAQNSVQVVVQGDETIRDFVVPKPDRVTLQTVSASNYALVHDDDLAELVVNTSAMQQMAKDPAMAPLVAKAKADARARINGSPPP